MSANLPNLETTVGYNFNLLDDVVLPDLPPKEVDADADRYIMYSRPIDTFTVKRSRVLLTPGVCDKCGFDLVKLAYEQNKLESLVYDDLPEQIQAIMQQLVKKHKQIAHSSAEDLIVTAKPKKWLSGRA